ncbi:MAG TPA: acyl-CoA thioesterase [Clostridiales bacterium]|nr:acyl-CoA thioesterase [Clostridiales bacterium]
MENSFAKRVEESKTEHVQIIMPEHINGYDRLFGGKLVEWIDIVAGVVARRHSNRNVTTVSIDNLHFKEAAYVNNMVVLYGKVTYVGNTSMEVTVETFVERLSGEKKLINKAYLVMVALDEDENPIVVPKLAIETEEEQAEWDLGARRSELRKQRRKEKF